MKKLSLVLIATAGLWCGQASAIPITWEATGNNLLGNPSGSFIYDADSNAYSAIDLVGNLGVAYRIFVSGTNLVLNTRSSIGTTLNLTFAGSGLTNAGGTVSFTSGGTLRGSGTVASQVPEPGSLLLLGAGLAGLGLLRRRKQAA